MPFHLSITPQMNRVGCARAHFRGWEWVCTQQYSNVASLTRTDEKQAAFHVFDTLCFQGTKTCRKTWILLREGREKECKQLETYLPKLFFVFVFLHIGCCVASACWWRTQKKWNKSDTVITAPLPVTTSTHLLHQDCVHDRCGRAPAAALQLECLGWCLCDENHEWQLQPDRINEVSLVIFLTRWVDYLHF